MRRISVRVGAALAALLMVGATACGSSKDDQASESDALTATTADDSSSSSSGDDSDLSELNDALDQLGDGQAGDCMTAGLAFFSLSLAPLGFMGGASEDDIAQLQEDTQDLRDEIPAEIRDDFETYADGIEEYADVLKGTDLSDLFDPETQQKFEDASGILDSPEMEEAQENIEAYFESECPSSFGGSGSDSSS